ncbi:hypothetical protein LM599_00600 [Candidatus Acetothermia bacterium]|nr:hypothetical protein [Candidatus Acetothermia bacterium]MCI2427768.1 hypothetical protein [Candidatus Acetothermia bacterium]MCI2428298.1 hypothetical protein [Candidatus Acetothermia bacterium]
MRTDQREVKYSGYRSLLVAITVIMIIVIAHPVFAQNDERFQINISGQKTWTLRYGIGDLRGLGRFGTAPGQFIFDQSLAADISGTAFGVLTIAAQIDDQRPLQMQEFTISLDTERVQGLLGEFIFAGEGAFVASPALLGLQVKYRHEKGTLHAVVGRMLGIPQQRIFRGMTSRAEVVFARQIPARPWEAPPYRRHLAGLDYLILTVPFIDDFSRSYVQFELVPSLRALLIDHNLEYLLSVIEAELQTELEKEEFIILRSESDYLLLRQGINGLLRRRIHNYIDTYNTKHGLVDEARRIYPWHEGSDYELAFLSALAAYGQIIIDNAVHRLTDARRQRFYDLGRRGIITDSVVVEISFDNRIFHPIDGVLYRFTLFPDQGIIELHFPPDFLRGEKHAVRVTFDYAVLGNMFMLGLALIPDSVRVYLNNARLTRAIDYSIDYEIGLLIIFRQVREEDIIRVEFESARGWWGGFAEHQRTFYGITLNLPLSEEFTIGISLLRGADTPLPPEERDRAHTMPNMHTVAGITGRIDRPGFAADFSVGWAENRFPFDDNLRRNMPNEITDIARIGEYLFFSHLGGISVYYDGSWRSYDTFHGLSGRRVYAIAGSGNKVFFATNAGLTVVSLKGVAPLDWVGNWRRYSQEDGLPDETVYSLALIEGILWIGTAAGLARVPIAQIDDQASWVTYTTEDNPQMRSDMIFEIVGNGEVIYLGTDNGVIRFEVAEEVFTTLDRTAGDRITDLRLVESILYVACTRGLRRFENGEFIDWLITGQRVNSFAFRDDKLFFGTERGLYSSWDDTLIAQTAITAIAITPDGILWAGSRATADYDLSLWRFDGQQKTEFTRYTTKIDGRDITRFVDIPAAEHSDRGMLISASFQRDFGGFQLAGTFKRISPQFLAIGRADRHDRTGWTLSGTHAITPGISLTATHTYQRIDAAGDVPQTLLSHTLAMTWDFGGQLALSATHSLIDDAKDRTGFDRTKFAYTIGIDKRFFHDTLALSLSWSDSFAGDFEPVKMRRASRVAAQIHHQITEDLSLIINWTRPTTYFAGRFSGRDYGGLTLAWSQRFATMTLTSRYDLTASRSLVDKYLQIEHLANLDFRFSRVDLRGIRLFPAVTLMWKNHRQRDDLTVAGSLRAELGNLGAAVTLRRELLGVWEERQQQIDRLSGRIDYQGIPFLIPYLTISRISNSITFRGETRATITHTLTTGLTWELADGLNNDFSSTLHAVTRHEETTITYTISNTLSYNIAGNLSAYIELRSEAQRMITGIDLTASLRPALNWQIADNWSLVFAAAYAIGNTAGSPGFYHSLIGELSVVANF